MKVPGSPALSLTATTFLYSSETNKDINMVIIFCGVPGSGKTTISEILARGLEDFGTVKFIVSDEVSRKVYTRIFKLLKDNLEGVDYILVDATFFKKSWRQIVNSLAGKEHVFTCYLHCPLEICLKRNRARDPSLPEKVIHIISKEMEPPSHPDISVDTETVKPKEAACEILRKIIQLKDLPERSFSINRIRGEGKLSDIG